MAEVIEEPRSPVEFKGRKGHRPKGGQGYRGNHRSNYTGFFQNLPNLPFAEQTHQIRQKLLESKLPWELKTISVTKRGRVPLKDCLSEESLENVEKLFSEKDI